MKVATDTTNRSFWNHGHRDRHLSKRLSFAETAHQAFATALLPGRQ